MYATHRFMVIHPCAKYGKPMSNHKKVMGGTQICTQTDRQSDSYTPPELRSRGVNIANIVLTLTILYAAKYRRC